MLRHDVTGDLFEAKVLHGSLPFASMSCDSIVDLAATHLGRTLLCAMSGGFCLSDSALKAQTACFAADPGKKVKKGKEKRWALMLTYG